jgi:hypothetical protein
VDPATPYLAKRIARPKFLKYPERNATNCDPRSRQEPTAAPPFPSHFPTLS